MKIFCVLLLLCCVQVQAQQLTSPLLSLRTTTQPQQRGADLTVELVVSNADSETLSYTPPTELAGTLHAESRGWVVNLHRVQPTDPLVIAPGQFVSLPYVLTLPGDAIGRVLLEVAEVAALRVVVDVSDTPSAESPVETLKQQETNAPPPVARIERTFANRFDFHEPIYFLYGPKAPAAKFQFSFKYRLLGKDGKFGSLIPPFRGLYFAYTQRSLWDLDADSSPFYDTSYMPEMFFEWLAPDDQKTAGWFHWLGLQTGVRHESNGKDLTDSRSLNIAYLRLAVIVGSVSGWHLLVTPRSVSYLSVSKDNADIAHYRGYGELELTLAKNNAIQIGVASRLGSRGHKGSVEVNVTQPIRIPWINLETYLQLQYFDGYGESLRTYNQSTSTWRVGLGFAR